MMIGYLQINKQQLAHMQKCSGLSIAPKGLCGTTVKKKKKKNYNRIKIRVDICSSVCSEMSLINP